MPDDARTIGGWRALVAGGRRSEWAVTSIVLAILAVVAFGAVAAPRLLRDAEASSLEQAIADAPDSSRRLTVRLIDDFSQGFNDDPLEEQRERLEDVASGIDEVLLERYGPPRFIVDSSRFTVVAVEVEELPADEFSEDELSDDEGAEFEPPVIVAPALPTFLTFRIHPELDQYGEIVEGRAAARTDLEINELDLIEFELTRESADELGWELGETVHLSTDPTDLVTRQFSGGLPDDFAAQLVGIRELAPPDDPYWAGDQRLHRPSVADTGVGANVFAFAMVAPAQVPTRPFMVDQRSPFSLEQRRDLIEGSIDLDTADATLEGLTALEASFSSQPTLTRPGVIAGLRPALEVERDQRSAARATLVLGAVGVLGVVVVTLGLLLVATFDRRRGWLTVARARGATARQMIAAATTEMAVIVGLAAAVGGALAAIVFGGGRTDLEVPLLAALVLAAIAAAAVAAWAESARPLTVSARPTAHPGLGRWGRIGGVVLVVVALAALVTFRRRGLATAAPDADLLVVLVPVLVPLALVYATRWLLPVALGQLARRGMALGPGRLVGLRRVIAAPQASTGVITVLVLALTVAALGLGVNRSLERGAVDASWVQVGAPYRIDTRDVSLAAAARSIPDAVVSQSGGSRLNLDHEGSIYSLQFTALDVAELGELTAGTAADLRLPAELEAIDLAGRVPVIASERVGGQRIEAGDVLVGVGARSDLEFSVVQTRSGVVLGRRTSWVVVDTDVYGTAAGFEPGFSTLAIGVPDSQRETLAALAADGGAALEVRADELSIQRDDPLSRAVRAGYLLAGLLAVALSVVAVVAVAVVTARDRRREVAILGLLGSGRREIGRAVASELVPGAVAGVVAGSIVGWFVVRLFDDRFDLSSFAGGSSVSIGPDQLGGLLVGVVLAAVVVTVIAVLVRRIVHASVSDILRIDGAA